MFTYYSAINCSLQVESITNNWHTSEDVCRVMMLLLGVGVTCDQRETIIGDITKLEEKEMETM